MKVEPRKHADIFGYQSFFFHTVTKIVQALVMKYNEILQALAVEGDVLLPK
jgi:hypothetical protein